MTETIFESYTDAYNFYQELLEHAEDKESIEDPRQAHHSWWVVKG